MPFEVHEPTLTVVLGLASLAASGLFFALAAFSREIAGVRYWAIGSLILGLALVIDGPRTIEDWRVASVVFNIPFNVGHAFLLAGTLQFCGRPGARAALWSFSAISVAVTLVFTFAVPDARWRINLLGLIDMTLNLWTGVILWRYADPFSRTAFRVAGAASLLEAAANVARIALVATSAIEPSYASPELPLANFVLWGGALLDTLVGDAMLFLLVMLRLVAGLRAAAERDPLTGLLNRRGLRLHFDALLERARGGRSLGIVMLDIDHFKSINDTYGHDAGDEVLKAMGGVLRAIETQDIAASRWGGEEFIVVVEGATRESLLRVAEQVRADFRQASSRLPDLAPGRTASAGAALAPLDGSLKMSEVIRVADEHLYRAKGQGRNRTVFAEPTTSNQVLEPSL